MLQRDEPMTVAAIPPLDVGEVLSFQERVRDWEDEPETPAKARELEPLLSQAMRTTGGLQSIWAVCVRDGSVWENHFYAQRIRFIESLAGVVVEIQSRGAEGVARIRVQHPEWEVPEAAVGVPPSLVEARAIARQ